MTNFSNKNDVIVDVSNVAIKFCRDLKKSLFYGVKDIANDLIGRSSGNDGLRSEEFWALKDINFDLKRGETLGLIGLNGSGKSTLLKILHGLIKPSKGQASIRGITGGLIELNAGMNPILTGRENIYVNASIFGVTKKNTDKIIDKVIDFSELHEFIDTPVQYYSSGMRVRLGFALATTILKPDFLILDEVLAVGDAPFRSKCYNQVGKLAKDAAVIFVSHNMHDIARICDKTLLLKNGQVTHFGDVESGIEKYQQNLGVDSIEDESFIKVEAPVKHVEFKWSTLEINYGDMIDLTVEIEVQKEMYDVRLQIPIYDNQATVAGEWYSGRYATKKLNFSKGMNIVNIQLGPMYLKSGVYKTAFVLTDEKGIGFPVWAFKSHTLKVKGSALGAWAYQIRGVLK
jgi:lipopolysaccharide transport system ATP-binding protein